MQLALFECSDERVVQLYGALSNTKEECDVKCITCLLRQKGTAEMELPLSPVGALGCTIHEREIENISKRGARSKSIIVCLLQNTESESRSHFHLSAGEFLHIWVKEKI